jgi:hypothetical protein
MTEPQHEVVATMAGAISSYLHRRSGVSLVELSCDVDGFAGDQTWGSDETNVVVWTRMSPEAIAAMAKLIADQRIVATPSNVLVYAFDGGHLDLPIAKDVRKRYAKPRWMPLVFAGTRKAT